LGKTVVIGTRKTCSLCKKSKPRRAFAKDASRADGKLKRCRLCDSKKCKAWRTKNKARARLNGRTWTLAHPDKKSAAHRRYREARPLLSRHHTMLEYGIDLEWFLTRLEALGNCCERCGKPFTSSAGTQVDHDHLHCAACHTGRGSCKSPDAVRGLVCGACNRLMSIAYCKAYATKDPYLIAYAQRVGKQAA
jgi:hypothetical protein